MVGLFALLGIAVIVAALRRGGVGGDAAARRAGALAEARVARRLRRLGRHLIVWNDVHVRSGNRTSQIDHVVWTPRGLVLIETKHWTGRLHVLSPTEWVQDNGRRRRVMHSPEHQSFYHERVMQEVLQHHGLGKTPLTSIIVLTHPASRVYGETTLPCVRFRQLRRWMRPYQQANATIAMPDPARFALLFALGTAPKSQARGAQK